MSSMDPQKATVVVETSWTSKENVAADMPDIWAIEIVWGILELKCINERKLSN